MTITSASVSAALRARASESPVMSATPWKISGGLVVVGEDDGVPLRLPLADGVDIGRVHRPLHHRHHTAHALEHGGVRRATSGVQSGSLLTGACGAVVIVILPWLIILKMSIMRVKKQGSQAAHGLDNILTVSIKSRNPVGRLGARRLSRGLGRPGPRPGPGVRGGPRGGSGTARRTAHGPRLHDARASTRPSFSTRRRKFCLVEPGAAEGLDDPLKAQQGEGGRQQLEDDGRYFSFPAGGRGTWPGAAGGRGPSAPRAPGGRSRVSLPGRARPRRRAPPRRGARSAPAPGPGRTSPRGGRRDVGPLAAGPGGLGAAASPTQWASAGAITFSRSAGRPARASSTATNS